MVCKLPLKPVWPLVEPHASSHHGCSPYQKLSMSLCSHSSLVTDCAHMLYCYFLTGLLVQYYPHGSLFDLLSVRSSVCQTLYVLSS